jgi:hypothetical protein
MMEKRQDQIPDEGFLMTKKKKKKRVRKGSNTKTACEKSDMDLSIGLRLETGRRSESYIYKNNI